MTQTPESDYSENTLVEQTAIALFEQMGWQTADCYREFDRTGISNLGRENTGEVVLKSKLFLALQWL